MQTCMPTCDNPAYMLLGLQGEVGELSEKFAKIIRKGALRFGSVKKFPDGERHNQLVYDDADSLTHKDFETFEADTQSELFDCLWFLAGIAHTMGWTLEDVAADGLEKLASRQKRHVIDGEGDHR